MLFLDACSERLTKGVECERAGIAVDPMDGMCVVTAAQPSKKALDKPTTGDVAGYSAEELAAGSPFAIAFRKNIKSGANLMNAIDQMIKDVQLMTQGEQKPYVSYEDLLKVKKLVLP